MDKREIVSVLSVLLLIASSEGSYDYFQIVQQWQPATCSNAYLTTECSQTPDERFSIHGVWPSLNTGQIVECTGSAFDNTKIVTIRAGLNENWPEVVSRQNQAFWSYEWTKHGTCSETYFNQLQYFTLGLNAYDLHKLQNILTGSNISANGRTYTRTEVEQAITTATGKRPALRCNTNYWSSSRQLHEISLCYTKNASILENCPSNANTCPSRFVWNSWSTRMIASSK